MFDEKRFLYLTATKANLINGCQTESSESFDIYPFIARYLLKIKSDATPAMQAGIDIHKLVYHVLGADLIQIEDLSDLDGRTKEYKDRVKILKEKQEKDPKFDYVLLNKKNKGVYKSIITSCHLEGNALNVLAKSKNIEVEKKLYNDEKEMLGYADIITEDAIYDIKTTSKPIQNVNDYVTFNFEDLAYQQVIYETLAGKKYENKTVFILIETMAPFSIRLMKLNPMHLDIARRIFFMDIYPRYVEIMKVFGEYFKKQNLSFEEKQEVLSIAKKNNLYKPNLVKVGSLSGWKYTQLARRLETVENKKIKEMQNDSRKRLEG